MKINIKKIKQNHLDHIEFLKKKFLIVQDERALSKSEFNHFF